MKKHLLIIILLTSIQAFAVNYVDVNFNNDEIGQKPETSDEYDPIRTNRKITHISTANPNIVSGTWYVTNTFFALTNMPLVVATTNVFPHLTQLVRWGGYYAGSDSMTSGVWRVSIDFYGTNINNSCFISCGGADSPKDKDLPTITRLFFRGNNISVYHDTIETFTTFNGVIMTNSLNQLVLTIDLNNKTYTTTLNGTNYLPNANLTSSQVYALSSIGFGVRGNGVNNTVIAFDNLKVDSVP